jgi:hypothetical protein
LIALPTAGSAERDETRAERGGIHPVPAWVLVCALQVGAFAGLASLQGSALVTPGHAEEGGPKLGRPSLVVVADTVGHELAGAHRPVLISAAPFELLFAWRLSEGPVPHARILTPPRSLLAADAQDELEGWLQIKSCDSLLLIDAPHSDDVQPTTGFNLARIQSRLASAGDFELVEEWHFPSCGDITAQVWRPKAVALHAPRQITSSQSSSRP